MTQEILNRFIFKTFNGEFGVNDPVTHDEIIGYYQQGKKLKMLLMIMC